MTAVTFDPSSAERVITLGCGEASSQPYALRLDLEDLPRSTWEQEVRQFLETVRFGTTTLALLVAPELVESAKPIVDILHAHYHHARINQNTIEQTCEVQARNFVQNLLTLSRSGETTTFAHELLGSMRGQTCFVVGAGPSLDDDIEQLLLHAGPVLAVNTSVGALARAGIRPDAVVCVESKPVVEGLARNTLGAPVIYDMTANPANVAKRKGPPAWFVGIDPNLSRYRQALGVPAIPWNSTCTAAAVSLAFAAGASRVALLGQDCAFADDGRMYASGAPYEGTIATINPEDPDSVIVEGPHKPRTVQAIVWEPGVGGVDACTTYGMLSFRDWFEGMPEQLRARAVNCTSSGVALRGIEHAPVSSVVTSGERTWNVARPDPARAQRASERARHLLGWIRDMAADGIRETDDYDTITHARHNAILSMWTSGEILRMRREPAVPTAKQKLERLAAAARRGCHEIREIIG